MNSFDSTQVSTSDRVLAGVLAALSTFILGYTVSRAFLLHQPTDPAATAPTVVPHEAALWSEIGRK